MGTAACSPPRGRGIPPARLHDDARRRSGRVPRFRRPLAPGSGPACRGHLRAITPTRRRQHRPTHGRCLDRHGPHPQPCRPSLSPAPLDHRPRRRHRFLHRHPSRLASHHRRLSHRRTHRARHPAPRPPDVPRPLGPPARCTGDIPTPCGQSPRRSRSHLPADHRRQHPPRASLPPNSFSIATRGRKIAARPPRDGQTLDFSRQNRL